MSEFEEVTSRSWGHRDCFGHCTGCISCLNVNFQNNTGDLLTQTSKRFVSVGSVRYGLRLGAVSPPPPGAGPRYRSQCCWPSTTSTVGRIPLLANNSYDIFSCVNRVKMSDDSDATSEQNEQASVSDQVLQSTKTLLKSQLRRKGSLRTQIYARLCECGDINREDIFNNLDRLPRFRFGGNRATANGKLRDRDKKEQDRIKTLSDRLKKVPVPPPRSKHSTTKPTPAATSQNDSFDEDQPFPIRSASFSQVDYSSNDNKYVRRRHNATNPTNQPPLSDNQIPGASLTLPRSKSKNILKPTIPKAIQNLKPFQENLISDSTSPSKTEFPFFIPCPPTVPVPATSEVEITSSNPAIKDNSTVQHPENKSSKDQLVSNTPQQKSTDDNVQEKKRDKSRRRKGMYIAQWPHSYDEEDKLIPQFVEESNITPYVETTFANTSTVSSVVPSTTLSPQGNSDCASATSSTTIKTEIPQLRISLDRSDSFDRNAPDTPSTSDDLDVSSNRSSRPTLSAQNSEEKENYLKFPKNLQFLRADSLSEGEPDSIERRTDLLTLLSSDISDNESRTSVNNDNSSPHNTRRYSKRPLRGPYGQMLEAEMKKPEADRKNQISNELKFLEDLSSGIQNNSGVSLSSSSSVGAGDPKPKFVTRIRGASNHSLDDSLLKHHNTSSAAKHSFPVTKRKVSADCGTIARTGSSEQKVNVCHQRTTSSPSKIEGYSTTEPSNELLEQLLRGSSEHLVASELNEQRQNDTRTHVVVELYDTERYYVESLHTIVTKYLEPLKNSELQNLLDQSLVDEIFSQIPILLNVHQTFLEELRSRLDHWDVKQKIGDLFLNLFSKTGIMDAYSSYVNNRKRATEILKNAKATKPGFAKFLEANAREHKGKLTLDSLLIKPIQKIPKYELLLDRLLKHTDPLHPDRELLMAALKMVRDELQKLNCTEREAVELDQLKEIESVIEGLMELVSSDRQFIRHDFVNMTAPGGTRKERALFLFSDLLLITSIKRRSGTIRRPPATLSASPASVTSTLEANKFKLLMKISLDDLEIIKAKDETYKQIMMEIESLSDDISILHQISELSWGLHCAHTTLDEVVKDMLVSLNKQLVDQQNTDNQLSCLDLTLSTVDGPETISIVFTKPEKRASWEESFNEAKHKLAMSGDKRPCPELVATVPIRKTRAGLQFTCAAPTMSDIGNDVWVCNSDGYVGQVCVLSLLPEANVTSCNGVCNARILCIASVPGVKENVLPLPKQTRGTEEVEDHSTIQFDSESSSDDDNSVEGREGSNQPSQTCKSSEIGSSDSEETDNQHSTMWLGTEDGCIHVYNSSDNIRIKKNKIRLQHNSSILSIIYLDNKVYVSLANGDMVIYERDGAGVWNTVSPRTITVGTSTMPVSKMIQSGTNLWCACGNTIKILSVQTLTTEHIFPIINDSSKAINAMALSGYGVWVSLQNSAVVKCFHALSYDFICEINVAPAVTKMLTCCDDIIRQHKAACLRVTALLACKELLWIGTSAGVVLTMTLPHLTNTLTKLSSMPTVMGIPHGHTGHVRFLTQVECSQANESHSSSQRNSCKGKPESKNSSKIFVISGGDGYEDFRSSTVSEIAGREDSTNHLLLWNI